MTVYEQTEGEREGLMEGEREGGRERESKSARERGSNADVDVCEATKHYF